jgi:hypothetical protein
MQGGSLHQSVSGATSFFSHVPELAFPCFSTAHFWLLQPGGTSAPSPALSPTFLDRFSRSGWAE